MLWRRLAAAAQIQPSVWELPYAAGAAPKKEKTTNKQTSKKPQRIQRGNEEMKRPDRGGLCRPRESCSATPSMQRDGSP